MFRMWCKIFSENHMMQDIVIEDNNPDKSRTAKVFDAIDKACTGFNLGRPIWLKKNITEFKRFDKARFYQDNFIETIDFDFLEIHVIEED